MNRLLLMLLSCWLVPASAWAAPEGLIKQAQQFERDNQIPKAVATYETFLQQHADHSQVVEVHYRLAKLYDILGKLDEMERSLLAVTTSDRKQFRNRAESFVLLAKHYAMFKKYDEAAKLLERLLSEGGAGLYEEEALSLAAGYYAVLKKYDDAAAKLNLLRLRRDSTHAEAPAYKLAVLWLTAGKLDLAVNAISEFAQAYPNHTGIPGLLLRAADAFREAKTYDAAVALCDQLQTRYPKSRESQARGIAAEAMTQSAELYFTELNDPVGAVRRFEEAAKLARDSESENKSKLLELCYFRLAEDHFEKKNWAAARENYLQLRNLGSQLNVAPASSPANRS